MASIPGINNYYTGFWPTNLPTPKPKTDEDFWTDIMKEVAKTMDYVEGEIDKLHEAGLDESFIDRCSEAFKAYGYDRLQELLFNSVLEP